MPEITPAYQTNWFSKFFECVYFCIAITFTGSMLLQSFMAAHSSYFNENNYIRYFQLFCFAMTVGAVVYSILWHIRERKHKGNSAVKHAWLRAVMRYYIAYDVSVYGFGKILKTQFSLPYSTSDVPVGSLDGFQLTWNYFGYSHTFAVILGLFQIGGGILLMFRRTSLLGVCILLPVMINIVLVNIFYSIAAGAFMNALIITFALLYLLFLRWHDLKAVFFANNPHLPEISSVFFKSIAKILVLVVAAGQIYNYIHAEKPSYFSGKWTVSNFTHNGKSAGTNEWQTDAMDWANVYFERQSQVVLSPNPYIYENSRANKASYSYDEKSHRLKLSYPGFSEKSDTVVVSVSHLDGKYMQWDMVRNSDTLHYELTKIETSR